MLPAHTERVGLQKGSRTPDCMMSAALNVNIQYQSAATNNWSHQRSASTAKADPAPVNTDTQPGPN